jgi:hypothetical protein
MSPEHLSILFAVIAVLGQAANAYLKVSILKEIAERDNTLRREIDERYVRKDVCQHIHGGCA